MCVCVCISIKVSYREASHFFFAVLSFLLVCSNRASIEEEERDREREGRYEREETSRFSLVVRWLVLM